MYICKDAVAAERTKGSEPSRAPHARIAFLRFVFARGCENLVEWMGVEGAKNIVALTERKSEGDVRQAQSRLIPVARN